MPSTTYYWDEVNDNLFGEEDENGEVIASYTHEPGLYGELIAQERNGEIRYYNYDGLGNTSELTDEDGNVTDTYEYSAFGEDVARTGTTENPFGYKGALGYYTNSGTNDIYVRARTYEPTIVRWLALDPLWFLDVANRYAFVQNSPITLGDPSGLMTVSIDQNSKRIRPCGGYFVHLMYQSAFKEGVLAIAVVQKICILSGYIRECESSEGCCEQKERKDCKPCCYLEWIGGGEAKNMKYPIANDDHAFGPFSQPGCTSQGSVKVTATVKAFDLSDKDLRQTLLGWKNKQEQCDAGCFNTGVGLSPHIVIEDGNEPNWFADNKIIVDSGQFETSTRWSCCNRPSTNWQTVDLPTEHWYWHGGAGNVVITPKG